MSPRSRPRMSDSLELLHGVVSMGEGKDLVRTLRNAVVSVEVDGKIEASSRIRVDGSYTITFGSLEGRHRSGSAVLRLTKTDSCREVNATRFLLMQLDPGDKERAVWRQDIVLQAQDMKSVCEVTTNGSSLSYVYTSKSHRWANEDNMIASICLVIGAVWGIVSIWTIARWATGFNSPATRHTYVRSIDFAETRNPTLRNHTIDSGIVYVHRHRLDCQRPSEDTASRRRSRRQQRRRLVLIDDDED